MTAAAIYLSRPPSADALYALIAKRVARDDDASLSHVETEVDEFITQFPNDPRIDVLRGYKERIGLDRLERQLQREMRTGGQAGAGLLPVEQLYLQAVGQAGNAPDKSLTMLESLIKLYGADLPAEPVEPPPKGNAKKAADRDAAIRTASVVQLARRRASALRADLAKQRKQQLAAVDERLAVAERLAHSNPQQAAAMYQAIIDLHTDDAWADKVVAEAHRKLAELSNSNKQSKK